MSSYDYFQTFFRLALDFITYYIYKKSSYLSQAAAYKLIINYYFQLTKS